MSSERTKAVEDQARDAKNRGLSRFYCVKLDELERYGIAMIKPKEGSNFWSIIPPLDPLAFYAREIFCHSNIGVNRVAFICMKETRTFVYTKEGVQKTKWNKPCPACEKMYKLAEINTNDERIRALRPSRRFIFFVVDTTNLPANLSTAEMAAAKKKVQWYDASPTFRDRITGVSEGRRGGGCIDVSDPKEGKTVIFDRIGKGMTTKYENFALEDRASIPEDWRVVPDYDEILVIPDYDETKIEVEGVAASDQGPEESGEEETGEEQETSTDSRRTRERAVSEDSPSTSSSEAPKTEQPTARTRDRRPEPESEKPKEESKISQAAPQTVLAPVTDADAEIASIRAKIRAKKEADAAAKTAGK